MLRGLFARLFSMRFAWLVTLLTASVIVAVSQYTYLSTTNVLRGGIALTDERIAAASLLQSLTDAETGQNGYLLTKDPLFLLPYNQAIAKLPSIRTTVVPFLDANNPASARQINDIMDAKLSEMATTIALTQRGETAMALDIVKAGAGRDWMGKLRQIINTELTSAANRQSEARVSIYDALAINHAAIIFLTLSSLLALYVFIRQLRLQALETVATEARLETTLEHRTQELRALAKHLQMVREDEKDHLARELHDELGALLTVAKLELQGLRKQVETRPDLTARVERVSSRINQVIVLKRRMVEDMRPSALSMLGLQSALQQLCRDMASAMDIPIHVDIADTRLTPESDLVIYRFFQEALTNVAKYSKASNVWVELLETDSHLKLGIRDDGVGFDTQLALAGRHGLTGMRYRMDSLGGAMTLASQPGEGTNIRAEIAL
jgi:signal transduction histidine kinase